MNESASIFDGLATAFQTLISQVLGYLPKVTLALLVLVLGWALARLMRFLVVRTIARLDRLWQRMIVKKELVHLQPRNPPTLIVGELVFWLLMLVFITFATNILGLGIFATWIKSAVSYLPVIAAGLLIVLVGFVVSSLVRDLVATATASAGLSNGGLLARTVQIIILFTAIILGINQIGIDIVFLSDVVGIILAAVLGGIALAFGLGARTHVSNLIAANQLKQLYQVGDTVQIGDIEGRIVDILVARVVIDTEQGSVDVPAKIFDEQVTIITEKVT